VGADGYGDWGSERRRNGGGTMAIEESVGGLVKLFDGACRERSGTFTAGSGEPLLGS
jgi:hypothetical protein